MLSISLYVIRQSLHIDKIHKNNIHSYSKAIQCVHYENTPIQIYSPPKIEKIQIKKIDIFHVSAQT